MKNKVLKQMLAFSLAAALVGGNSVATFAAEPTNGTESSTNTQAATDATGASATFRVDTEKGYFDGYPETMSETTQENLQERDYAIGYFPAVVAREGYVWTGWKITDQDGNSTNVGTEYAGAKTWMFTPKAGNVKVVATFKKTVTEKNATLVVKYVDGNGQVGNLQKITRKGNEGEECTFNITDLNVPDGYELVTATWEKSVAYGNAKSVTVEVKKKEAKKADAVLYVHYLDENNVPLDGSQYIVSLTKNGPVGEKATFAATSFTAPEGYELVGNVTDVEVAYGERKDVNVNVKAIKEEKEARDVIVNFNVAPEEGQFKDPAGAKVVTYTIKEDSADQFLVPTVEAKEGYEFTGWLVNGKEEGFWSADAKTFGITGLAHFPEGDDKGYIVVTAQFKEVKEEKAAVVNANVVVDPEKGEFEGYDGATKLENNNLQEADDTLGFLPTVTAKEGYTWTGWEVTNKAGEVVYTLDTNTSSIMFPYGVEDDYTVTATFTKDETPVDPVDPVDPTEPTQPTQPATPSTNNTVNNATNNTTDNKKVEKTAAKKAETKNENKKAPKTGDESMPIAYMLTLVGAAVAAIIVLIKRKRTI